MNIEYIEPLYLTQTTPLSNTEWWSPFYYSMEPHKITGFLHPYVIRKASNYTCKSCGNKILQKWQIVTEEPYRPTYHVKCYNELYELMIKQLVNFKITEIDNIIPDEDKKEL